MIHTVLFSLFLSVALSDFIMKNDLWIRFIIFICYYWSVLWLVAFSVSVCLFPCDVIRMCEPGLGRSARPWLVPGTPAVPCDLSLPPDWWIATNGPFATRGGLSLKAGSRLWCFVHLAECCLDICVAVVVNNSTTGTSPLFYTCFSIYPHFLLPPLVFTQMSFFIQITNCPAPSSVKALVITRL